MDENKIKPTILQNITEDERLKLREKSAQSLPDVPSVHHWTPKQFKNAITKCLFDNKDSFYEYINRLALVTGLKFDEVLLQIIKMDVEIDDLNQLVFTDYFGNKHYYSIKNGGPFDELLLRDLDNPDRENGKIYLYNNKFMFMSPSGRSSIIDTSYESEGTFVGDIYMKDYIKNVYEEAIPYIGEEEPDVENYEYKKIWFDTSIYDESNYSVSTNSLINEVDTSSVEKIVKEESLIEKVL